MDDADDDRLRIWLGEFYGFIPKVSDATGAVLVAAQSCKYHPVREYLTSLVWDKKPRVRSWLAEYLGVAAQDVDSETSDRYDRYVSLVGTKWLIAAVARVMRAPIKADCVMILEGNQGLGKSTAVDILGGEWFSDTHFALGDKDGYQQMQGVWLCELAELDSFNKAESTRSKQFFSSKEDRYRPSYGRRAIAFPRQCVFVGSTNRKDYLKDATGNRRYWPVWCTKIDAGRLRADRDQLWAEALQLFNLGESWWVDDCDTDLFEAEQEKRFNPDVWEEVISEFLYDPQFDPKPHYTTADIMEHALKLQPGQMKPPEQTRVGLIMSRLNWQKKKITITADGEKRRAYVYLRPIS